MWKKGEIPEQDKQNHPRDPASSVETVPARHAGGQAIIGRSITIRGEVTGDEDLVIQGRVDGSVDLKLHAVTVGPEGHVKANISGRIVTVEGRVEGNVLGAEQVVLRRASSVQGDITAPRVVLEDGAHFRGGVQMADDLAASRRSAAAPAVHKAVSLEAGPLPAPQLKPAQPAPAAARSGTAKTAEMKG